VSFIHYSYVGHFDHDAPGSKWPVAARPLDAVAVARLAAEFGPEVADSVSMRDGYALCRWGFPLWLVALVHDFMDRLAAEQGCEVMEQDGNVIDAGAAARELRSPWIDEAPDAEPGAAADGPRL
jgi:hypothetical protein